MDPVAHFKEALYSFPYTMKNMGWYSKGVWSLPQIVKGVTFWPKQSLSWRLNNNITNEISTWERLSYMYAVTWYKMHPHLNEKTLKFQDVRCRCESMYSYNHRVRTESTTSYNLFVFSLFIVTAGLLRQYSPAMAMPNTKSTKGADIGKEIIATKVSLNKLVYGTLGIIMEPHPWHKPGCGMIYLKATASVCPEPNFIELLSSQICLAWNFFLDKNRINRISICCILLVTSIQLLFAYPVNHVKIWLVILFLSRQIFHA